jgi:hypothetical protein
VSVNASLYWSRRASMAEQTYRRQSLPWPEPAGRS